MAIVQIRNVIERRGELALLRSMGFTQRRLGRMVLAENCFLLIVGLGIGVFAALLAVIPHVLSGGARIPWNSLVVSLLAIAVVGLLASSLAVSATMRSPLIPALRGE
jgi:ABC-type antimicrobial peptide transport system permease subunit